VKEGEFKNGVFIQWCEEWNVSWDYWRITNFLVEYSHKDWAMYQYI
jgi:hypothetical protein